VTVWAWPQPPVLRSSSRQTSVTQDGDSGGNRQVRPCLAKGDLPRDPAGDQAQINRRRDRPRASPSRNNRCRGAVEWGEERRPCRTTFPPPRRSGDDA